MSPLHCPKCGRDRSQNARTCPNCGCQAIDSSSVTIPENGRADGGFPGWTLLPIGMLAVILLMLVFVLVKRNEEINASQVATLDVSANQETITTRTSEPIAIKALPIPISAPPMQPAVAETRNKGKVALVPKVSSRNGSARVVRNEKFYLLDQEVEAILSAAGVKPIDGHSLKDSLGMSIVFPDRYRDFNHAALDAIQKHIKYSGKTDGFGKAQLNGIEPNGYFLFGMTRSGQSFSVWNSPVSVQVGENILNLAPQTLTEIQDSAG